MLMRTRALWAGAAEAHAKANRQARRDAVLQANLKIIAPALSGAVWRYLDEVPRQPRDQTYCPCRNRAISLAEMAKWAPSERPFVLIPRTRPSRTATSGPPEFPGFMAASVWTYASPFSWRAAEAIPFDTEEANPNGDPIAQTSSPTTTSPRSLRKGPDESDCKSAMSLRGSTRTTFARTTSPFLRVSETSGAPRTTCSFVRLETVHPARPERRCQSLDQR
jgi:hypothetical protein